MSPALVRALEKHLVERRLACRQIDTDAVDDDVSYENLTREALYDAIIYAAAAYIKDGRRNERMSSLEREFLGTVDFMEAETDEEARAILRKQRGLDDHGLILFVMRHHNSIESRFSQHRTAISTLWHVLEWRTSYF